ncbi:MAG TPA: RidA family protein [Chloroflexota bacterium]|jgi:2-iminobutanoate/2-iminopropanoate deaminase|nr:RidA family protein [Chloroflexota bacterium]
MEKQLVNPPTLFDPGPTRAYSHGVRVGSLLFLAGQMGIGPNRRLAGDFAAQVRQAFANLEAVLRAAGGSLANLVTMTVFLTDMRYADEFVRLRGEILQRDFPASALIGVSQLAVPGGLVEIQAIAALD